MKRYITAFMLATVLAIGSITSSWAMESMDGINRNLEGMMDQVVLEMSKEEMMNFVKTGKWDLLGWKSEQLYFRLRDKYAMGNPLKELTFDLKTLQEQFRMMEKVYQDNDLIYDVVLVASGAGYILKAHKAGKAIRMKNKVKAAKNLKKVAPCVYKVIKSIGNIAK